MLHVQLILETKSPEACIQSRIVLQEDEKEEESLNRQIVVVVLVLVFLAPLTWHCSFPFLYQLKYYIHQFYSSPTLHLFCNDDIVLISSLVPL